MGSGGRHNWVSTHIHTRPFIVQNRVGRWGEKRGRSQLVGLDVYFGPMPSNVTQGLAVCFLSIYFKNLTWPHDTLDLFCFQPVGEHKYMRSCQNMELSKLRCNQFTCLLESLFPSLCSGEEICVGVHQGLQIP